MTKRFLIVEDETTLRESLKRVFGREGYDVEAVSSAEEALARIEGEAFDVILTDIILPGIDGIELLGKVREQAADQIGGLFPHSPEQLDAVDTGEDDVRQDDIEGLTLDPGERLLCRIGGLHVVPLAPEDAFERLAQGSFVFDDE